MVIGKIVDLEICEKVRILVKAFDHQSKNSALLILMACNKSSPLMSNSIISNDLLLLRALLLGYGKDLMEI